MTFSCVRDKISESIRPTGPAHPHHPHIQGRGHMPQDRQGSVTSLREPGRPGQHTCKAAVSPHHPVPLLKGHRVSTCLTGSYHARWNKLSPGGTRSYMEPLQRGDSPAGSSHLASEGGTVLIPVSHTGRPRTEVSVTAEVTQQGSGGTGFDPGACASICKAAPPPSPTCSANTWQPPALSQACASATELSYIQFLP